MRSGWRQLAMVGVLCLLAAALLGVPATTFGEEASTAGDTSSGSLSGPLVVHGSPTEAEQLKAQEEAKRNNPIAVAARKESQTKFERLSAERALRVDSEVLPRDVNDPAGGPPRLPVGERLISYEATNAAVIELPSGKHGVVESLGPIATPSGHGRFTPINLALHSTVNGYTPMNSDVAVDIPNRLGEGVRMSGDGVSLTPVGAQGNPLGGSEGAQKGASIVYANTQTDTDILAKPTSGGFEVDSLLRSINSPTTLYFKVGMPQGAQLVSEKGPGGARIVLDGQTIGMIAHVSARDAVGTNVPVGMSIAGSTLVITVQSDLAEYDYPIDVDPRAYDYAIQLPPNCKNYEGNETNWEFHSSGGGFKCYSSGVSSGYGVVMTTVGTVFSG